MLVMVIVACLVVMNARAMISVLAESEALLVFGAVVSKHDPGDVRGGHPA